MSACRCGCGPEGEDGEPATWRWCRSRAWWRAASFVTWSRARGCSGARDLALSASAAGWMSICRPAARHCRGSPAVKSGQARPYWRGLKVRRERKRATSNRPRQGERGTRRARARQMVAARLERLEDLSISKLVPSTLTLLGLCSGATAIRFALMDDWHTAVDQRGLRHDLRHAGRTGGAPAGRRHAVRRAARLPGRPGQLRRGARRHHVYLEPVAHGRCGLDRGPDLLRLPAPSVSPASMCKACATKAPPRPIPISPACPRPPRPA